MVVFRKKVLGRFFVLFYVIEKKWKCEIDSMLVPLDDSIKLIRLSIKLNFVQSLFLILKSLLKPPEKAVLKKKEDLLQRNDQKSKVKVHFHLLKRPFLHPLQQVTTNYMVDGAPTMVKNEQSRQKEQGNMVANQTVNVTVVSQVNQFIAC